MLVGHQTSSLWRKDRRGPMIRGDPKNSSDTAVGGCTLCSVGPHPLMVCRQRTGVVQYGSFGNVLAWISLWYCGILGRPHTLPRRRSREVIGTRCLALADPFLIARDAFFLLFLQPRSSLTNIPPRPLTSFQLRAPVACLILTSLPTTLNTGTT